MRQTNAVPSPSVAGTSGSSQADALGIASSHPTWMVERWLARLGEADTLELLAANKQPRARAVVQVDVRHFHVARQRLRVDRVVVVLRADLYPACGAAHASSPIRRPGISSWSREPATCPWGRSDALDDALG